MSAEIKKEIELEIAHVLSIDIVGYSKLLINEQRRLLELLSQIVRATEQFRTAEANARLITIPTGDGMALVFRRRATRVAAFAARKGFNQFRAHAGLLRHYRRVGRRTGIGTRLLAARGSYARSIYGRQLWHAQAAPFLGTTPGRSSLRENRRLGRAKRTREAMSDPPWREATARQASEKR